MIYDCICPAAAGRPGRICGVDHPACFALGGGTAAAPTVQTMFGLDPDEVVANAETALATWRARQAPEPPVVPTAATTVCGCQILK